MDTSSDGGTDSLQECDERPRIVRDELPAVTRGSFPSLDYVHCPVPGCKFSTGKGLLRNSLANHWAAAGNVETHSCYELVVPDINKGKRKSAEQARNQKAKQRALMHTFFLPLMYLINHLWLKSKCEAVVEGMGGIVSLHGDKSRGRLRQELTEIEALVHYNFPPLASRACEVLIEEVLNHYFTGPDGKQRPWHFEHATTDQGRRALFARRSKVMRRHDEAEVKHAFLGCDV